MKRFLNLSPGVALASAVLLLAPMIASAATAPVTGPTIAESKASFASQHFALSILEYPANAASEAAVAFSDLTSASRRFSLVTGQAESAPAPELKLWADGAVALRFAAQPPVLQSRLRQRYEPTYFGALLVAANDGSESPVPMTESEFDLLSLGQLGPVPEPATALFGLALVGFCSLARVGSRTQPTPR